MHFSFAAKANNSKAHASLFMGAQRCFVFGRYDEMKNNNVFIMETVW